MNGQATPPSGEENQKGPPAILSIVMLVTLSFPMVCALLSAVWPDFTFPAIPALLSFGAFAAILIYVFIDPLTESKIAVGGITLSGAAALLFVLPYFFHEALDKSMNGGPSQRQTLGKVTKLQRELESAKVTNQKQASELQKLRESGVNGGARLTQSDYFSLITSKTPNTALNAAIIQSYETKRGPFDATLIKINPMVRFESSIKDGTFEFCEDHNPDLNTPIELDRFVDGQNKKLVFRPVGPIGPVCNNPDFGAVIKLGCDGANAFLSKDESEGCTASTGVLWKKSGDGAQRAFRLDGHTLNPKFID